MKTLKKSAYVLSLMLASVSAQAGEWMLNNEQSQLSFISTKKVNVAEVHQFGTLSGGLNEAGQFTMEIDLASVDTGIEIRDSRMKEFLFDIVDFPKAVISASVEPEMVTNLPVGESMASTIDGQLNLHGQQHPLSINVLVTKVSEQELLVVSSQPLVLNAADYELVQGVEKLRELAGLPSISYAVPVSFYLTLNAAN